MRLSEQQLAARGGEIQALLRPIARVSTGPAWKKFTIGTTGMVFGTHDGTYHSASYKDSRFATTAHGYQANYFEAWRRESKSHYVVEKMYLSIYDATGSEESELLCLHCDPTLAVSSENYMYKRGPHLHMSMAGYPFARAHLAVCGADVETVLKSSASLHAAMAWAIQMIRDEVFALIVG